MMSFKKTVRVVSWLCLLLAAAILIWAGFAPKVSLETLASSRHADWSRSWKNQTGPLQLNIPGELLPATIPGPADSWAGNSMHQLDLRFTLPPGTYTVELSSFDAHEALPPLLSFNLNGVHIGEIRIPKGGGQSAPYSYIAPDLTVRLPLLITKDENQLIISTHEGSWVAPARIRMLGKMQFYPAKLGWELVTNKVLVGSVAFLLLTFIFLRVWSSGSIGSASASTLLAAIMAIVTFTACELLFRQFLIRKPEARIVSERQITGGIDEPGRHYTYSTMIEPNPHLDIIYTLKPNIDGIFAGNPLKTNSYFMRGPEVERQTPPGTIRVMGLGDSVMFGWGVAWEDAALTRLGNLLAKELNVSIETLNLGCPSYNAANNVASYARLGRPFQPKLVVMIILENDFGFPGAMIDPVRPWTVKKSYVRQQVIRILAPKWRDGHAEYERFVSTRQLDSIRGKDSSDLDPTQLWHLQVSEHYHAIKGVEAMEASLLDLAAMLKEDKALGIVIYHPLNIKLGRPESHEEHASFVVETARRSGMLGVDMSAVYEKYLERHGLESMRECLWFHDRDWHPNEVAHELMALAVLDELQRNDVLPRLVESIR